MATLRHLHRLMNERRTVVLTDGRTGKISRVDTFFPKNETVVTVWLRDVSDSAAPSLRGSATGSGLSSNAVSGFVKVGLDDVVGLAPAAPSERG